MGKDISDMGYMFCRCKNFKSDLSRWDVSRVTNMQCMFDGCESFNSDLADWNVSNVDDMINMFDKCDSFNYDLSSWDISKTAKYKGIITVREHMKHINEEYIPRQRKNFYIN